MQIWTSPVDNAPLPRYRLAVLVTAAARHRAWLAGGSGLAARSQATYLQQAARYLAWLDERPGLAAALTMPAAASGSSAGEAARQAVADRAAARYHSHLARSGAAPASLKLALAAIGSLYRTAGLRPPQVPGRASLRPYGRPQTLSQRERAQVAAAAAVAGTRDRALAALADEAGLRPAELAALDAGDVGDDAGSVRVRDAWHPHRNRVVPVSDGPARAALREWLAERGTLQCADEALFTTRGGRRISLRTVQHVLGQLGQAAGVRLSPRRIRNTRTAEMVGAGAAPQAAMLFFGHARTETLRPFAAEHGPDSAVLVAPGSGSASAG
jgi:integrase/recombinase XerC